MEMYYVAAESGDTGPFTMDDLRRMMKKGELPTHAVARKTDGSAPFALASLLSRAAPTAVAEAKERRYARPLLATLGYFLGIVAIGLAIVMASAVREVTALSGVFAGVLTIGVAQLIDLLGRIEFNTRR